MTDDGPIDDMAIARSLRRLDEIAARRPEMLGERGTTNVAAWIDTLADDEHEGDMAKAPTKQTQLAIRLPAELIDRLDQHAERMNRDHPGLGATRADAVRTLLTAALDRVEAAEPRKGKRA